MGEFVELSDKEKEEVDGGIAGVDDVIFWTLVAIGLAAGIALGINRKRRKANRK